MLTICRLAPDGRLEDAHRLRPFRTGRTDWYALIDGGAVLHPDLEDLIAAAAADRPDVGIFYGDEVVTGAGPAPLLLCKPAFDRTQAVARDYMGLPLLVHGRTLAELGGPSEAAGSAVAYDLVLRAMAAGIAIDRITEFLAARPAPLSFPTAEDRLLALRRRVDELACGCDVVPGLAEGTFQLRRRFEDFPAVTLVVPTRQGRGEPGAKPLVLGLLQSLARTDWPMDRLTVLIGDDVEDGAIYASARWPFRLRRTVTRPGPGERFNYAAKMNRLWREAEDEYLVLMNDDLVVREPGWLRALMTFAADRDVGGVGARLLYPDGTLQHVGMPAGVMGTCTHAFIGAPASEPTYQHWGEIQREWSVVTGAVFATRRSLLRQVNGLDERFTLNFNDVDLCFRLRLLGYRIVYTPGAELTHFESASRGKTPSPAYELAVFMERWRDMLADDPAYHPRLTRTTPMIRPVPVDPGLAWWTAAAG